MKTFIECLDIAADRLGIPEAAIDIKFAHEDKHYELMQTAAELYAHLSNLHKPDVMESVCACPIPLEKIFSDKCGICDRKLKRYAQTAP